MDIVDDHKADHLRETYMKSDRFHLIKLKLQILRYIEKYDFIKQINQQTTARLARFLFNRKFKLGYENAEKRLSFVRLIIKSIT